MVERGSAILMMRTGENAIDEGSRRCQFTVNLLFDGDELIPAVKPIGNAGLVSDNSHRQVQAVGLGDDLGGAGDQPDILGPPQVICFLDDGAVTVEKQAGPLVCSLGPADDLGPYPVVADRCSRRQFHGSPVAPTAGSSTVSRGSALSSSPG